MNVSTSSKLLLTAAMTVALVGCSTADKNQPPPPQPAPIVNTPPPPPPPVREPTPAPTYIIEDVHFDFDRSELKPEARETLDEVVQGLRDQPDVPYEVGGHTDSIGSVEYNQGLSERRAQAVYDYLVGNGVDGNRLTVRGYSESRPIASNATSEGRAQNRRVEVKPQ